MFAFLLTGAFAPFTFALALLMGLLLLELVFAALGGTLLGGEADADLGDAPEVELDLDLDADVPAEVEFDAIEGAEAAEGAASSGGSLLGLSEVPSLLWGASFLMGFGLTGTALQLVMQSAFGAALPGWIAALITLIPGLVFARGFSRVFARLLPKTETSALSERSLGRRRGTITQGTAARGRPAEVRVMDGYGNTHYLRAEPLHDGDEIPQGTEVLVLRDRRAGAYHLVAISD